MTRQVLLLGAIGLVGLAVVWVTWVFVLSSLAPAFLHTSRAHYVTGTLTSREDWRIAVSGLGVALKLWLVLILFAGVSDYLQKRNHQDIVGAFAVNLNSRAGSAPSELDQSWEAFAFRTSASGEFDGVGVTVSLTQVPGRRSGAELHIDIASPYPWTLDIEHKSLIADVVARFGAAIQTGYPEVDEAVDIQADDAGCVRKWLENPDVRANLVSLFQDDRLDILRTKVAEGVFRAVFSSMRHRATIVAHSKAILEKLTAIVRAAERVDEHERR